MKKLKQSVSLLLSMLMVLLAFGAVPTMAAGAATNAPITAVGNETTVTVGGKTYTVVRTKDELTANLQAGKDILFGNDIDMGGAELTSAICNLNSTIDGNGFALTGFSLKNESAGVSLFNVAKYEAATVRNLTIGTANAPITVTGGENTAVLFGKMNSELVEDPGTNRETVNPRCSATLINVNVYANVTGGACTGMFIGWTDGGVTIQNCNSYGSVKSTAGTCGGMIGKIVATFHIRKPEHTVLIESSTNYATVTSAANNLAGMIGEVTPAQDAVTTIHINNSENAGTVSGSVDNVAGFIGYLAYKSTYTNITCNISNSINSGAITGNAQTGGFLGNAFIEWNQWNDQMKLTFDGCKNTATVTGNGAYSGGIAGYIQTSQNGTTHTTVEATNCVNTGNLAGSGDYKGGFCGYFKFWQGDFTVRYFLNVGNINGEGGTAAGVVAYANFKPATFEYCVNFGNIENVQTLGAGIYAQVDSDTTNVKNCMNIGIITKKEGAEPVIAYLFKGNGKSLTSQTNYYIAIDGMEIQDVETATALTSWKATATLLNNAYAPKWGGVCFFVNEAEDGLEYVELPEFVGVQQTKAEDGKYNIRLVAVIDTLQYAEVGFRIVMNNGTETNKVSCRKVFSTLKANDNGEMISYTAQVLGGKYIYALTVEGLSDTADYTFTITPYALDKTDDTVAYTGTACTVTYTNGAYVSGAPVMPEN